MSDTSFESTLSSIASNPELLNKISNVVKNNKSGEISDTLPDVLSILSESMGKGQGNDDTKDDAVEAQSSQDATIGIIGEIGTQIKKSTPLLLAIKPYLNKNRQGLVENLVKLSSLASVINLAGGELGKI